MFIILLFLVYLLLTCSEIAINGGAVYTFESDLKDSSSDSEIIFTLDPSITYEKIYKSNLLMQISDVTNIENEISDLENEESISRDAARKKIYLEKYRPLVELKLLDDAVEILYIRSKDQWTLDKLLAEVEKFARAKGVGKLILIDDAYFEELDGCKYKAAIYRLFFTDVPSEQISIYFKKGFVMDSSCAESFKKAYEIIKEEPLSRFVNEKNIREESVREFFEQYKNVKIANLPKSKTGPCSIRKTLINNIILKRDPLINEITGCIDSDKNYMVKRI